MSSIRPRIPLTIACSAWENRWHRCPRQRYRSVIQVQLFKVQLLSGDLRELD